MKSRDALVTGLLGLLMIIGAFTGTAGAGVLEVNNGTITYSAWSERNKIDIVTDGEYYIIKDKTLRSIDDMDPSNVCDIYRNVITCPASLSLSINAGDDNDSVRVRNLSFKSMDINHISGGTGNDNLRGPSRDKASYRGILRFDGGPGADTISGGGTADYSSRSEPVSVSLSRRRDDGATLERDLVSTDSAIGGSGADVLTGSTRNDAIWGGNGADRLNGNIGDDTLDGGSGSDVFVGNYGQDTVKARDGVDDTSFDCGDGLDNVIADGGDPVSTGGTAACEQVDLTSVAPSPDQEAIDILWNVARRAMDQCALENNGSFTLCDEQALIEVEPALANAAAQLAVAATSSNTYQMSVMSYRSGSHSFVYTRNADGTSDSTCSPVNDGLCAADGRWHPDPDAEATEVAGKAEAALELGRLNEVGRIYQQLDKNTLILIDPTLNDAGQRFTLDNVGPTSYRILVSSESTPSVTYVTERNGADITRTCAPAGNGACSAEGTWQGDPQIQARAAMVATHRALELYFADGSLNPRFTYAGASAATLSSYDWALAHVPGLELSNLGTGTYRASVSSAGPNPVEYILARAVNGNITRSCSPSSGYSCRGGQWLTFVHDRADVETMSQANHIHRALNLHAATHGGSYDGFNITNLHATDPSIDWPGEFAIYSNGTGFNTTVQVPAGNRQYAIYRSQDPDPWLARFCTPAGSGVCGSSGSW